MAKLNNKQIYAEARAILEASPEGVRWSELLRAIARQGPETSLNTIQGATLGMLREDRDVVRVSRGIYQLRRFQNAHAADSGTEDAAAAPAPPASTPAKAGPLEVDFYKSFADWLSAEEEVTAAEPLGGSILRGKWGTPDVLGIRKPQAQDILKFETQIVSAEIKLDSTQPVVAFGQAVAYTLFSHRTYIVVPRETGTDDLARLEALCRLHGIGLVTFVLDKDSPDYRTILVPIHASPDMFYANQMLRRLLDAAPKVFNKLL